MEEYKNAANIDQLFKIVSEQNIRIKKLEKELKREIEELKKDKKNIPANFLTEF